MGRNPWRTSEKKAADLNMRIEDYNLEVPSDIFQWKRIDMEREVGGFGETGS